MTPLTYLIEQDYCGRESEKTGFQSPSTSLTIMRRSLRMSETLGLLSMLIGILLVIANNIQYFEVYKGILSFIANYCKKESLSLALACLLASSDGRCASRGLNRCKRHSIMQLLLIVIPVLILREAATEF